MSDKFIVNGKYIRLCRDVEDIWLQPESIPKLSQRLRMAVRVLRRRKNATGLQELERGK